MSSEIKITFLKGSLKLENINNIDSKNIYNIWEKAIEDYNEWIAKFKDNKINNKKITEFFECNGFSLWWINSLCRKDTELNNLWIKKIFIVYFVKKYSYQSNQINIITDDSLLIKSLRCNFKKKEALIEYKFNFKLYVKYNLSPIFFIKNNLFFLISILLKTSFLKLWKYHQKNFFFQKKMIWFLSYFPMNWIFLNNQHIDRHLHNIPNSASFKKQNAYLLYINNPIKNFKFFYDLIRLKKKSRVVFVEAYLTVCDIFYITLVCFKFYIKIIFLKKKKYKKNFIINKLNFFDILNFEMSESFYTNIQNDYLHGLCQYNFFRDIKGTHKIISYDELWLQARSGYFFGKKRLNNVKSIALQHSLNSKNYGACFNSKKEFHPRNNFDGLNTCPAPDFFIVQGTQYYNLLSTFYPKDKISISGNLKSIEYRKSLVGIKKKENIYRKKRNILNKKIILVPLSSKDAFYLIDLVNSIKLPDDTVIVITPHSNNNILDIENKLILSKNIIFEKKFKTWNILPFSETVICGYSNLIYESSFFNINSAMFIPLEVPPTIPFDNRVNCFYTRDEFLKWFYSKKVSKSKSEHKSIYNYYYGSSSKDPEEKIWKIINSF